MPTPMPESATPCSSNAQPAGAAISAEGAVVIVAIEQARRAVARDVDVRPAVVVEIGRRRAHPVGSRRSPVRADEDHGATVRAAARSPTIRDVGEGPVAAIAIEDVGAACIAERTAWDGNVVVATVGRLAWSRRLRPDRSSRSWRRTGRAAVAVVIEEAAAARPRRPATRPTPAFSDTSVKVPSPLLR